MPVLIIASRETRNENNHGTPIFGHLVSDQSLNMKHSIPHCIGYKGYLAISAEAFELKSIYALKHLSP